MYPETAYHNTNEFEDKMFEIDKWYQCVLRSYSKPKIQTSIQQPNYDFKGLYLGLLNFEYSVNVIL